MTSNRRSRPAALGRTRHGGPPVRRRRPLTITVTAVALVALVGCSGGEDAAAPVDLEEAVPAQSSVEVEPELDNDPEVEAEVEVEDVAPLVTQEVLLERDPFEPVVPDEVSTASADATDTETDTDVDVDVGVDADEDEDDRDGGTSIDDPDDDGDCRGRYEVVCDDEVVTLVEVGSDDSGEETAIVQVDTVRYEARVGQTFARNYELRDIDEDCVTLSYGNEEFEVCRGGTGMK